MNECAHVEIRPFSDADAVAATNLFRSLVPDIVLTPPTLSRVPVETQRTRAATAPGGARPAAKQTPAIDVDQAERDRPSVAADEQANAAHPRRSPSTSQHDERGRERLDEEEASRLTRRR